MNFYQQFGASEANDNAAILSKFIAFISHVKNINKVYEKYTIYLFVWHTLSQGSRETLSE